MYVALDTVLLTQVETGSQLGRNRKSGTQKSNLKDNTVMVFTRCWDQRSMCLVCP